MVRMRSPVQTRFAAPGVLAQLIERCIRIAEVAGLSPAYSTIDKLIVVCYNEKIDRGGLIFYCNGRDRDFVRGGDGGDGKDVEK